MRSEGEREAFRRRIREYERSEAWRARSRRYRAKHARCEACGVPARRGAPLDCHHVTYDNAFTGREPDRDLRTLCRPHHDDVHNRARRDGLPLELATAAVIAETRRPPARSGGCLVALVVIGAVAAAYAKSRGWW